MGDGKKTQEGEEEEAEKDKAGERRKRMKKVRKERIGYFSRTVVFFKVWFPDQQQQQQQQNLGLVRYSNSQAHLSRIESKPLGPTIYVFDSGAELSLRTTVLGRPELQFSVYVGAVENGLQKLLLSHLPPFMSLSFITHLMSTQD